MVEDEDQDQELAFRLSNGHNLIISGQAGAGKTYVIKRIIRHWNMRKKLQSFAPRVYLQPITVIWGQLLYINGQG